MVTVCGEIAALSVSVKVPCTMEVSAGVKVTCRLQVLPMATEAQFCAVTTDGRVEATPVIFRTAFPQFAIPNGTVLEVPRSIVPKSSEVVDKHTEGAGIDKSSLLIKLWIDPVRGFGGGSGVG